MAGRLFRGLGWLGLSLIGLAVFLAGCALVAAVFVGVLLALPR